MFKGACDRKPKINATIVMVEQRILSTYSTHIHTHKYAPGSLSVTDLYLNGDSFTTQLQSSMLLSLGLDHWNPKQVGSYSCNFPPVSSEILWDVFHIVSHPLKIPNLPLRQHCSLHLPDIILEASAEISQYVFWPHLNTSWQWFPFGSPSTRCRCKVLTRDMKNLYIIWVLIGNCIHAFL